MCIGRGPLQEEGASDGRNKWPTTKEANSPHFVTVQEGSMVGEKDQSEPYRMAHAL